MRSLYAPVCFLCLACWRSRRPSLRFRLVACVFHCSPLGIHEPHILYFSPTYLLDFFLTPFFFASLAVQDQIRNIMPVAMPPVVPNQAYERAPSPHKRPARIPGLVGTNAAFLVPDNVRKKFIEGWTVHVPLTFLTDKGCLLKGKALNGSTQDVLTFDSTSGQVMTTSKPLSDFGELDLTFDEWHQAWRRLLDLIRDHLPEEFLMWEAHYSFILNSENRSEMWPLYVSYDTEIRKRATRFAIDPSKFAIGIWNDLETRYMAKKVASLVHADLKQQADRIHSQSNNPPAYSSRNVSQAFSFRGQTSSSDSSRTGRCIFCGSRSRDHPGKECVASCYADGSPCHLLRQEPSGTRVSKSGKRYCYSWNGTSGCTQNPCKKGEHICTLCGAVTHNAQQCLTVA